MGNRKFIAPQLAKEVVEFCRRALDASSSNAVPKFCSDLNDLLSLKTFVVGTSLSAADVTSFVVLYPHFATMKEGDRYQSMLNVARWFDLVQFQLGSSNVMEQIAIPHSVPVSKKKKEKKGKN